MHVPALPPLNSAALLLDLDGTLLDLAPRPDAVVLPAGLPDTLRALRRLLGDAVAVVTGRSVEMVDALLGDAIFAVAGEHGGAIRHGPGQAVERTPLPSPPGDWLVEAERLALDHPGTLLEHKARGFALHYRAVPAAGPALREALSRLLAGSETFELLPAHMLWEVRPRGVDKGKAVVALMDRPPFRGRLPVFIGDDVTDEDGIAAAARWAASACACRMYSATRPVCARGCRRSQRTGSGRATQRLQHPDLRLQLPLQQPGGHGEGVPSGVVAAARIDCHCEFTPAVGRPAGWNFDLAPSSWPAQAGHPRLVMLDKRTRRGWRGQAPP